MFGYIYKTTNLVNGKIYIGQHKCDRFDSSYLGSGKLFKRALQQYGKESFSCEMLCECFSQEDMNTKEIQMIQLHDAKNREVGYNLANGGVDWSTGYHQGMLGKRQSNFQKSQVSKALSGVKKSNDAREHMRISKYGNSNASGGAGLKFMHKDNEQIRVPIEQFEQYLSLGWSIGKRSWTEEEKQRYRQKYSNGRYINKDGKTLFVSNDSVQSYVNDGWSLGKSKEIYAKRKKPRK